MDVGLELRQARERRGLSLQQISRTTKISLRVLQAIEASDETRMPAPVFTRSFVKTYAGEVGLDPDEMLRRYVEQFAPPPASPDAAEPGDTPPGPAPPRDESGWGRARILRGRFGTPIVLLAAAVAAVALGAKNYRAVNADATQPVATPPVSAAGFVPAGAAQPKPAGTSGTTPAPGDALRIAIAPTGPCWVEATVGGQSVLAKLLAAGDRREVDAPSDVILRVGDPAAFAFSINGMPARVAGAPGKAVTVHVTKENYRTFVRR